MKTGYKGTYNLTCRNHKFEIGQTYELPHKPIICEYGFHYCTNPKDVLQYYTIQHDFRLLEIEDLSDETVIDGNKSATNKIRIVREVLKEEYYSLFGMIDNVLTISYPSGSWKKFKYDERNNCIRYENSTGYWIKHSYDERNNLTRTEYSYGYWIKRSYDEQNNLLDWEDGFNKK